MIFRININEAATPTGLATLLGLAGAGLRLLSIPPALGSLDAVNFARSLSGFDPVAQAPHGPGYPVFVFVARLFAELGLAPRVALALPSILLWPLAAVVLHRGLVRHVPVASSLGLVALASLAPGLVALGGAPLSDGLGLSLLALAVGVGALALDPSQPNVRRLGHLAGVLAGLVLGVRLSWAPLVASLAVLALWRWRRLGRPASGPVLGGLVGVFAWAVPMFLLAGPLRLTRYLLGFGAGHLGEWGGALDPAAPVAGLFSRLARLGWNLWDVGLGAAWPLEVPLSGGLSGSADGLAWGLAALGIGAAGLVLSRRLVRVRDLGVVAVVVLPYLLWVALGQNPMKPRHVLVLLPLLGLVLGPALSTLARARLVVSAALAVLALGGAHRAVQTSRLPAPAARLAAWQGSTGPVSLFAGEEAAVVGWYRPDARVQRPLDAGVLTAEATRLQALGVPVVVTSTAPGARAVSLGAPLVRFTSPPAVHPQDPALSVHPWPPPTSAALAHNLHGGTR